MRRFLKIVGYILLTPIVMLLMVGVLIYIPPIQNWLVNYVSAKATEGTGLNVHVDEVGLTFLLDLDVRGVTATNEAGDTLLDVRRVVVDLDLSKVFDYNVGVDEVSLHHGFVDTKDFVEGISVRGRIGGFSVSAPDGADLKNKTIVVDAINLYNCDLQFFVGDLNQDEDTTQTLLPPWIVSLGKLDVEQVHLYCNLNASMEVETNLAGIKAREFDASLADMTLYLSSLESRFDYVVIDSISLPRVCAKVEGLAYDSSHVSLDSALVRVSEAELNTVADVEWSSIDAEHPEGIFDVSMSLSIPNKDLDSLCNYLGVPLMRYNRNAFAHLHLHAVGNMSQIHLDSASIVVDKILSVDASGCCYNPLDSLFSAKLQADMRSLAGNVAVRAQYDNATQAYSAALELLGFNPCLFYPDMPIHSVSATASVVGQGLDVTSTAARMNAAANIRHCFLDSLDLGGADMRAQLMGCRADVRLDYKNEIADVTAQFNVMRHPQKREESSPYEGTLGVDLRRVDMRAAGVTDSTLSLGGCIHVDFSSDLISCHRVTGSVNDILFIRPDTVLRPVALNVDMLIHPDSLYAYFAAGEMFIEVCTQGGINDIQRQTEMFIAEYESQMKRHFIDQNVMRPLLPKADVKLRICGRNPVSSWLAVMGYTFNDMRFTLNSDPEIGVNGCGSISALNTGVVLLDTIRWDIFQDSVGVQMNAQVKNGPKNKQFVFDSRLNIFVLGDGAGISLTYIDGDGQKGVDVGLRANLLSNGVNVTLTPLNPIVAYRHFSINPDNYVFLGRNGDILANVDMLADDGTGLQLYSGRQLSQVMYCDSCFDMPMSQDLTASFRRFNLGELSSVLPYLPRISGFLDGDVHYMQQESTLSMALDTHVRNFAFETAPIGDVSLNAVYLPSGDGGHYVDGMMGIAGKECVSFSGTYSDSIQGGLMGLDFALEEFPLSIVNGFVEKGVAQASGCLNGAIHVTGSPSSPVVNGSISTDDVGIKSTDYSLLLSFENHTIAIRDNFLDFDELPVYSTGKQPIILDGWVDFCDLNKIMLDFNLNGKNFELINAKKSYLATAYGKVYCDVNARLFGTLDKMNLKGRLNLLGNTDVTYVLRDSPLTVDDRLKDLVTFVDFDNEDEVASVEYSAVDVMMNMKVTIDDAARVHCLLSEDKSSYVDLEGGGEFVLTYSPSSDIQLNGRYTVNSGEMKYQLPVIPLKTFNIENGSYVAFNGKILNPTLNIVAKERMKAAVGEDGKANRSVAFDVGVNITQTLENMGLQFTIDAPEDATVRSELETMDETTRGRIAVTMFVTGMYMSDNNNTGGGGFSTENALNAFLQSEITSIAGKALSSVDLTFGMENTTKASGASQTDYSFRFAKHFWGNRVSVVLGGTVSSGSEAENTGATLIDNVSIEYRLDDSATRYVRVFYDKTYESLMDGKLTEMGAGLVLRRKTTRLGDLFIFRKKK